MEEAKELCKVNADKKELIKELIREKENEELKSLSLEELKELS